MSTDHADPDTSGHPGDDHGHDEHAVADEPLGPIDVAAWGAGIIGIAIGLAVAFCFVVATA